MILYSMIIFLEFRSKDVDFTNILRADFLYESILRSFYALAVWLCNFIQKNIFTKATCKIKCWWNWFQPSISSMFYARVFCTKFLAPKISNPKASFVQNLGKKNALPYKKRTRKMLVKLISGFPCCSLRIHSFYILWVTNYQRKNINATLIFTMKSKCGPRQIKTVGGKKTSYTEIIEYLKETATYIFQN